MLILSRGVDESIKIGDDIYIVVIKIQGRQVKIGIDAPKCVRVVRTELLRDEG